MPGMGGRIRRNTHLKEQAGDLLARIRLGVVDEVVITRYGKPVAVLVRYEDNGVEAARTRSKN